MKKNDLIAILSVSLFLIPFFIFDCVYQSYIDFNAQHGFIMSFIKFALLATFGEMIGLRIKTGHYNQQGFGVIPRAIVWGFLGLTIKAAFIIFATGAPNILKYLGFTDIATAMSGSLSLTQLLVAFTISVTLNTIYAPILMTVHKITDMHIMKNGGTVSGLFKRIEFGQLMVELDWKTQWNFIFKKTIPLFWIPAHTITFLLPSDAQILFAALLGIALGIILSISSLAADKNNAADNVAKEGSA